MKVIFAVCSVIICGMICVTLIVFVGIQGKGHHSLTSRVSVAPAPPAPPMPKIPPVPDMPKMAFAKKDSARSEKQVREKQVEVSVKAEAAPPVPEQVAVAREGAEVRKDGSVRFLVTGQFRGELNAARESALQEAREQIRAWLISQDPPITRVPSLGVIEHQMLRQNFPPQEEMLKSEKMYKATIEVDMQPSDIRALRAHDRTAGGFWVVGGLMAIFGVTALLYRFDEWTKGYLTRWLIAGGMASLGVALVLFWYLS